MAGVTGFYRAFYRQFFRADYRRFPSPVDQPHDVQLVTPESVSKAASPNVVQIEGAGFQAGDTVMLDGVAQTTTPNTSTNLSASLVTAALAIGYHDLVVNDSVFGDSNRISVLVTA
jgi:hypothetical protein